MASRAFKTIDQQITTGGDYIEALRRKTMYTSIMRKVKTEEGALSIAKHDSNVNIEWCSDASRSHDLKSRARLKSTINYSTLLDIAKGKRQANPVLNGSTASKFNIFTGNFAMVHAEAPIPVLVPFKWDSTRNTNLPIFIMAPTGPTGLATTNTVTFPNNGQSTDAMDSSWNQSYYPGWWFDPLGVLTELNCNQTEATNLGKRLVDQVEITYRWSHAYWRSVAGQSMSGFSFPENVTFYQQPTDFKDPLTKAYGPLPEFASFSSTVPANLDTATKINVEQVAQLNEWCKQQGSADGIGPPKLFNVNMNVNVPP